MRQNRPKGSRIALAAVVSLATVWLAALLAPCLEGGLVHFLSAAPEALRHPFSVSRCEKTGKAILFALLCVWIAIGCLFDTGRKRRPNAEHGSAAWGSPQDLARRYGASAPGSRILTKHVALSHDTHRHLRNLNVVVCGGSGSGKTRTYAKANLLNACGESLVILDPKNVQVCENIGVFEGRKCFEVQSACV